MARNSGGLPGRVRARNGIRVFSKGNWGEPPGPVWPRGKARGRKGWIPNPRAGGRTGGRLARGRGGENLPALFREPEGRGGAPKGGISFSGPFRESPQGGKGLERAILGGQPNRAAGVPWGGFHTISGRPREGKGFRAPKYRGSSLGGKLGWGVAPEKFWARSQRLGRPKEGQKGPTRWGQKGLWPPKGGSPRGPVAAGGGGPISREEGEPK